MKEAIINLMDPAWHMMGPEHHKGALRNVLWSNGWRDGVEITLHQKGPILMYSFEEVNDKQSNPTQFSEASTS